MSNPSASGLDAPRPATIDEEPGACDLCGLTLRFGARDLSLRDKTFRFCCIGCRQVFRMLADISDVSDPASFKETEIFRQCQGLGIIPRSEADLERREQKAAPKTENDIKSDSGLSDEHTLKLRLSVEGMWCPACAWVIENSLLKQPGVVKAVCNFSTDRVTVNYDPVRTSPPDISKAIEKLGYTPATPGDEIESSEKKREFVRFGVSAFLTMNVMMLSFALYSGFFTDLSAEDIRFISWPILAMATVVVAYGGKRIHVKGWAAWRSLGFGMETLVSAGSLCAYFFSLYNFFAGSIHLYFDTASMLTTLVLLGKIMESRAKERVTRDLESFFSIIPTKARIATPEAPNGRYVSAEHLRKGSWFILEENEISPADGMIVRGRGAMDESTLTGEPLPVAKKPGDNIKSGARLVSGTIAVKAESVGEDSTLGRMIEIMEKALGRKTPLEGKTDIALKWFAPAIFSLAFGTGVAGWLLGLSVDQALVRAVTVMVISCPCALGIAIPLARTAGISLAAKNGILVRDFSAFETAPKADAFVFDKTGSMTEGDWKLMEIQFDSAWTREEILSVAAGLEKDSDHHVALKIRQRTEQEKIRPADIRQIRLHESGVSGIYENKPIMIGSAQFLSREIGRLDVAPNFSSEEPPDPRLSAVYMAHGNKTVARFLFGDRVKKDAAETIRQLRERGCKTFLISGDGKAATDFAAKEMDIPESQGEMLPEDKAEFIEKLKREGRIVAMAGDGVNDAPALTRAHVAIAFHSGSRLGKEAAHVTLMRGEPMQTIEFLDLAKKVTEKIHQNLAFSFVYNAISIPVAMAGLLSPLVAVCAMLTSSISVTGNTALLFKTTKRPSPPHES